MDSYKRTTWIEILIMRIWETVIYYIRVKNLNNSVFLFGQGCFVCNQWQDMQLLKIKCIMSTMIMFLVDCSQILIKAVISEEYTAAL